MVDPGTALAIASLTWELVKDVYSYYRLCESRDDDVEEVRRSLLWLQRFLVSIRMVLKSDKFDESQVKMVEESVLSCKDLLKQLQKRLEKVKREEPPESILSKVGDHGRRFFYPFRKETIAHLIELIDRCKNQMTDVIGLLQLDTTGKVWDSVIEVNENVTSVSKTVGDIKAVVQDGVQRNYRQNVMDWLDPIDQSDVQNAAVRKHEEGTGSWFLGGDQFKRWNEESGSSLCIFGDVGCGKTVLFSSIVKLIGNHKSPAVSQSSMAYFYCLYRKGAHHDLAPILRTFIWQLCPMDCIPLALKTLYNQHSAKFPPGVPSDEELVNCLAEIIYELTHESTLPESGRTNDVYLLVDALDELPIGSNRRQIIGFLDKIASLHIEGLHIIATSRHDKDISQGLKSWDLPLFINKEKVIEDMRLFITNEIEKDPDLSIQNSATKDMIVHRLVDEGNGMFRWAALQMEELKALNPKKARNIIKTLKLLPKDLDETYERILAKIRPGNSYEALNALTWISFATRPLFIEELVDVCAIQLDTQPAFDAAERYTPTDILNLLPGILTVHPPLKEAENPIHGQHVVTFAHFSVQEYLIGDRIATSPAKLYGLKTQYSNHFISRCCLAYLSCCNTFELRNDNYPLRGYAWDFWAWHAAFEAQKTQKELDIKAQELFVSVVHQKLPESRDALGKLMSRLSDVAGWPALSDDDKNQLEQSLKFPFFYPEFESEAVEDVNQEQLSIRYKFLPLQQDGEIRLIELFPASKRFTEIRCRMFTASLESKPLYDGVSYYWGGPRDDLSIRVNGLLLNIPGNITAELRNVRGKDGDLGRVLFVDGVCFDYTTNSEERETKVSLMPQIFRQAQQVAIGIGDKDEADASAIEFVRLIASKSAGDVDYKEAITQWSRTHRGNWADCMGLAILRLFERRWWRRIWPVQELILPQRATLYYGDMSITFDTFQRFFSMTDTLKEQLGDTYYSKLAMDKAWIGVTRISMIRTRYHQGQYPTLPELLWATQYHEARNEAIKVYALFGLLSPEDQKSEYLPGVLSSDAAISDEKRYTLVAIYVLRKYPNLDILSYSSCHRWQRPLKDTIPSWVPDFSISEQEIAPLINGIFGPKDCKDIYSSCDQAKSPALEVYQDPTRIVVQGYLVDIVHKAADGFTEEPHSRIRQLYKFVKDSGLAVKTPKGQSEMESFLRTIQVDQRDGHRLKADVVRSELKTDLALEGESPIYKSCSNRRLLISAHGYLCMGPVEAEIGDVIAVMPCGKVPYILRRCKAGYTFIGECYVHGLMDGEIVATAAEQKLVLEEFCLV